ncbi:MAG TPA: ThiF family adenylyltransferase [Dehalococcoidia bacterium]|nr:ThiF family adenylyltransferase [Dehalococcoidia bacterium]
MTNDRFHRQELLFGRVGQERLQSCTVALVGLGGLGSHVAQQLAYLGVRSFRLVDRDIVDRSNLNRLVGASESDLNRCKVDVASDMIKRIMNDADVLPIRDSFVSDDGFSALKTANVVFGCMDRDASRLVLNEFCQAYERPYFDLATDIDPSAPTFGGRVLFADGRVCVICKAILDQEAIRLAFSSETKLEEDRLIYGIDRFALDDVGPAVVSLNGILASVAVTEFVAHITRLRDANLYLEYRGMQGVLVRDNNVPAAGCYYCKMIRGLADDADLGRYIRDGLNTRLS